MRINGSIFGYEWGLFFRLRRIRKEPIDAVTNRTKDGYYIVFLDYDNISYDWVKDELYFIQAEFNLNDFYIFESSKECFHAVCFDKLTLSEYRDLLYRSSCDHNFRKIPYTWGKGLWTLRYSEKRGVKPRLAYILNNKNEQRTQSLAHRTFFKEQYQIPIRETIPTDGINGEESIIYATYKI